MSSLNSSGRNGDRVIQRRGKYTSRACDDCRRRRTKCDGKRPSCSQCQQHALNCCYAVKEDGRNPAPKAYVQQLRKRIQVLEHIVQSCHANVDSILERCPMPTTTADVDPELPKDIVWDGTSFDGAMCLDECTNFDRDGEARYFGPSSGRLDFDTFAISAPDNEASDVEVLTPLSKQLESNIGSSREHVNRFIQEMEDENSISTELENHLLGLYFDWQEPWCQIVDEDLFRQSRQTGGRYFSQLLLNSILAFGSRLSDHPEARASPSNPNTAGTLFLEKAEVLLHYDMKWPSITTIQALLLMSNTYVATGADAAGWLHQGMANRLAIDMGLNIGPRPLGTTSDATDKEMRLKRRIYLSLYVLDKFSATYTGRVCTVLHSQGSLEPAVPTPSHHQFLTVDLTTSTPKLNEFGRDAMQCALVTHARITEKILSTLYAPVATGQEQRATFVENCQLELRNWLYDLPSDLRLGRFNDRPPQVFVLNMVYHTSYILLVKPFLCKLRKMRGMSRTLGDSSGFDLGESSMNRRAIVVCRAAAGQIHMLARGYRSKFGSFRRSPITVTHCILSATLIFLQISEVVDSSNGAETMRAVEDCLLVLRELSEAWNPAERYYQTLSRIWEGRKAKDADKGLTPSPQEEMNGSGCHSTSLQTEDFSDKSWDRSSIVNADAFPGWNEQYMNAEEALGDCSGFDWLAGDLPLQPQWLSVDICPLFGSLPEDYSQFDNLNKAQLSELSLF